MVGYVITEFTDLTWECNGLLDFQRQPKAVAKCMAEFQSQDVLIAEWEQPCIWSGEPVRMHIYLSHYSSRDVRNAELHWHLHDEHDGNVIAENNVGSIHVRRAHVERIVTTELLMPDVTSPQWFRLDAQLRNADEVIASTHKRLLVIPREWRVWDDALPSSVYVHDPQGWFGDLLERLGVSGATIADKPTDAKFIITASLDEVMQCELKRGASVLWIVERARAVPSPLPEFTILDRRHKGRWGDWCSSFIWLASELRRELSAPAILCAALRDIVPNCVIEFDETRALHREGCELKPHVRMLAGIFVGWLHHQAGIAVEFGIGDGKLLVTTFPLASKWLRSPAATAMLRCMMKRLMHK
ncbi:MAG TPA: hypothetical protein EYP10_03530 [Armatimonadetes bacterium]|nr:hypothetical protein [Armatimonadota bacterium]